MKIEIGALDTLPREGGIRVTVGDEQIAMFRVGNEVLAVGDRCSHAEASLAEGEVFDHEVECPRHGSEFDLRTGRPLSLPATKSVPTYEVSIEEGIVYLVLEDS
jgi:3-phenylpropionate/trans-cinnamate dioxygenase ferredoxin subunit